MEETYETIYHETSPDLRARVVYDQDPHEPDGDAQAPCLITWSSSEGRWAEGVYVPTGADDILHAYRHFGKRMWDSDHAEQDTLFERYLRLVIGARSVEVIDLPARRLWVFDTPDFREHIGLAEVPEGFTVKPDAEEWRAYFEGEVFGVVVEKRRTGHTVWSDGTEEDEEDWTEVESVWGYFGSTYATGQAREMLKDC